MDCQSIAPRFLLGSRPGPRLAGTRLSAQPLFVDSSSLERPDRLYGGLHR